MTPQIKHLVGTRFENDHDLFRSFDNEPQAVAWATEQNQPFVYKLPRQNTWLVAVAK